MITTRIKINLVAFAVLAAVTIGWSVTSLFEIDRFDQPYEVTVQFTETPGLTPGFDATYLGFSVGSISSVELIDGMSVVRLKLNREVELPAAVDAAARRRSAIGEPYVDLSPRAGTDPATGPRLAKGDTISIEHTTAAISYAELFTAVEDLVDAIDPDQLGIVISEAAAAVDGRGDDLRRLVIGARDLTAKTVSNAEEIDQFISDLGALASVAADHRDSLAASIDGFAELAETLEATEPALQGLLDKGPSAVALLSRIIHASDDSVMCTLSGLASLDSLAADPVLAALSGTLTDAAELNHVLADVISDEGFLRLTAQLSTYSNAAVYAQPLGTPVAPTIPDCPQTDHEFVPVGEVEVDTSTNPTDGADLDSDASVPPRPERPADEHASGTSDLESPGDPAIIEFLRAALPYLLAAAVLGAVGWAAWRNRDRISWPGSN